ncbi:MAG: hypothetical protein J7L53_00530 [Deltaproteobacteria bacterium]|nr:hypothetical protein [Deltaproteobacteria bacterium]
MDIRDKVPVVKVSIRGANGRMGLQAIYASMENNEDILARAKTGGLTDKDVWIDIVFGAFTADIPTVQQLMAGVMRSEKRKVLEGYDKKGRPIYRMKAKGKLDLRTGYLEQGLDKEPQRDHVIPFDRQEVVDTPEGLPAIKILSKDKQNVLSVMRHINVRLGELSAEAIMDRVLDVAYNLGTNVFLSAVGDTAKNPDKMRSWIDKIHDKGYAMGFLESAPAKGWENRMLSRQNVTSILASRNFSPTGTLFRTGLYLRQPLFDHDSYELSRAADKFKRIMKYIVAQIISTEQFRCYAKFLDTQPATIKEIEGEPVLVNFPPGFLTVISSNYLKFSFYEDNEYGFVCAALIPNLKALGIVYKDKAMVRHLRQNRLHYEVVTNIPGIFGTTWMVKAPQEIISRGGALSTSSCTTNGNIVGDFVMFMALYCYYDFFYPSVKEYISSPGRDGDKRIEEIIEKRSAEFKTYLGDFISHKGRMIRTVFNFYYDDVMFMDTDMQHGLTRAESPDVIEFLRETSSGSQTEVPRLLSLPERELKYFMGLRSTLKKQSPGEKDEQIKDLLNKVESTMQTIKHNINIVDILENVGGNKSLTP